MRPGKAWQGTAWRGKARDVFLTGVVRLSIGNQKSQIANPWRQELTPVADYAFRKAYGRLSKADAAVLGDVLDLVAFWNKRMAQPGKGGRNRIRILTVPRIRTIRQLLQAFTADEIAEAIEGYSRATWQKRNKAWMTSDHFFTVARITPWIEAAIHERERRAALAGPKDARVARLANTLAERTREKAEKEALQQAFNALSTGDRDALRRRAIGELVELGRRPGGLTDFEVRMQCLVALRRQQAAGKKGP